MDKTNNNQDKGTLSEVATESVPRSSPEVPPIAAPPTAPTATINPTQLRCSCVVDTNVVGELYSVHDLLRDFERCHEVEGAAATNNPKVRYRRLRMADSLALAIALHEKAETSFQLVTEAIEVLTKEVPPDSTSFERSWLQFFLYYTKEYCLADWKEESDRELGAGVKGTACDTILLEVAKAKQVPLITNEGNTELGIDDKRGLRKRARKAGVDVFTPGEYVARLGVAFPAASIAFGQRFHARQEEYLSGRSDAEAAREHFRKIHDIYVWCFEAAQERAKQLPAR